MSFVANAGTFAYRSLEFFALNIGASHKVTSGLDYRRRWQSFLPKKRLEKTLWIHGASVGELEDLLAFFGNPELLSIAGYSADRLVVTSSSPSAENFLRKLKSQAKAQYAGPLPPDVLPRVEEFFNELDPELLILSQSDTWPVLLNSAKKRLRRGALWLPHKNSSASWAKNLLLKPLVRAVGLRHQSSSNPLPRSNSVFVGIPRLDRILERMDAAATQAHPLATHLDARKEKKKILIGSAWKEDLSFFNVALEKLSREEREKIESFAIPHDPRDNAEISAMIALFGNRLIMSEGKLLESYPGFDVVMVGGGFRSGLHNITEALAWGLPTFCGPRLEKQPEAPHFVTQGALRSFSQPEELAANLRQLLQKDAGFLTWKCRAEEAQAELLSQRGASRRLAELIRTL